MFEIVFGAVLVAMSIAILGVTLSISKLDKNIWTFDITQNLDECISLETNG